MAKKFKWVVEFTVDECWVADGFEMTDESAHLMIQNVLKFAYPSETSARVIKSPDKCEIRKAQGYHD